jgi:ABC-2 type transport system ATP-binding protein
VTVDRDLGPQGCRRLRARPSPKAPCWASGVEITYDKDRTNAGEVLAMVQGQGLGIVDVSTREADLEDVFVSLTSNI